MGSQESKRFDVKRIAIIGAGPCGLAAAKYLLGQNAFEHVVIYEQQDEVGGVWYYSKSPSKTLHVPQVSAFCPPDPPIRPRDGPPIFPSPMYDVLHTNIPRDLMEFSDLEFPKDGLIFPPREAVLDYVLHYAREIRHLITFSTRVKDVRLRQENAKDQWDLDAVSVVSGDVSTATYDAIVVASGHYSTMYIPALKNIEEFHEAHPGIITHSKLYRRPDGFEDKKVVVVGNAASGLDIATQIGRVCKRRVLLSVRKPTPPENLEFSRAEEVPEIEEFLIEERGIRFVDGRVETNVDAILFSTGYLYTFPFLTSLTPPLVTNGRRVYSSYRDLFNIEHPTLVFPGLPIRVVPFALSESQAAVFARVWANVWPLPSQEDMKKWEEEEAQRRGDSFHVFPKGGDTEYINGIYDEVVRLQAPGKMPPQWGDKLRWQREIYVDAKLKFEKEGRTARSLEELGFVYRPGETAPDAPETL